MTDTTEHATATAATHQPTDAGGSQLVSRYHRDGYVVLSQALSATEVQGLRDEAVRICRGELGAVDGAQPPVPGPRPRRPPVRLRGRGLRLPVP